MNAIQSVGVIQETRNYGLFDFVKGNRDINRSHVNRLKDKIKRRDLKEIPILVLSKNKQGKYPIFDGQHRFAARSELNKPIQISMKDKKVMETKIESLEEKNKKILSKNQKLENKLSILMARLEKIEKIALGESNSPDLAVYKLK